MKRRNNNNKQRERQKKVYEEVITTHINADFDALASMIAASKLYPGASLVFPHKVEDPDLARVECLACHAGGGWSEELKRHTPITPHPEQEACRQCHIAMTGKELFADIDWRSVATPRLGRSELPGAPPPIPHELQMRGNCIACHVGPGAVATIRVEHPSRGNCRQCHVPDINTSVKPFQRNPQS